MMKSPNWLSKILKEENAEATKGSSENKKGTANKDMKKD